MKEIDELSSGIEKLKRNSDSQKRLIEQLQKDRAFLLERTRLLSQKLSEAYVVYEEAGKRILDFVDRETAPIKEQIDGLKAETAKITEMEKELKSHSAHLSKTSSLDESLRVRLLEAEKTIKKLNELASISRSQIEMLKEREAKDDQALESRLSDVRNQFDTHLKAAQDRLSLKVTEVSEDVLQDATDSIRGLAGSHEELKRNLSHISVSVKQLKVNSASLRKSLESAGFARAELEKRVSGHQASIKSMDSAVSKLARRLESVNLEDNRLEKRLSELRKGLEESISSKAGKIKESASLNQKKQAELLNSRIKRANEDFSEKILGISDRLSLESKRIAELQSVLNEKIAGSGKKAALARSELGKRLSSHQASLRAVGSAISRMEKRLEGISLEDEKLEKRLSELRKEAEEGASSKVGQLRAYFDSHNEKQAQLLKSKIVDLNGMLASKVSGLSESFDGKLDKVSERVSADKHVLSQMIDRQNSTFVRFAKEQHAGFESARAELEKRMAAARRNLDEVLDSRSAQIKAHADSQHRKQNDALYARLKAFSQDFVARMEKINERLASESREMDGIESALSKSISVSDKRAQSARKEIEKRLSAHKSSLKAIDSTISRMGKRLDSIKLEDAVLEKRLAGLRKYADEKLSEKVGQLRAHVDSLNENQSKLVEGRLAGMNGLLESKALGISEDIDGKIAKVNERLSLERKQMLEIQSSLNDKVSESDKKTQSAKNELEKRLSAHQASLRAIDSVISRMGKRLDSIKLEDAVLEKRLAGLRKYADEKLSEKVGQLKEHVDLGQKKQAEFLEGKLAGMNGLLESKVSGLSGDLDGKIAKMNGIIDSRFAGISEKTEKKVDGIKAHLELSDRKHAERMESRLKAINEFERKISEVRKGAEDGIASKVGQLKAHVDSHNEKMSGMVESRFSDLNGLLESKVSGVSDNLEGKITKLDEKLASEKQDLFQKIERQNSVFAKFAKEQHGNFESARAELEKRMASLKSGVQEVMDSRQEQLRARVDSHLKKQDEALGARFNVFSREIASNAAKLNERLAAERREIGDVESLIAKRITESQKSTLSREKRIEREIAKSGRKARLANSALSSRINKQAADFRILLKEEREKAQSAKDELEKKLLAANSSMGEAISSKTEQLKERVDSAGRRQAEILEARMKAVAELEKKTSGNAVSIREIGSALSGMAKRLDSIGLEDDKLEKRLSELRKSAEESASSKVGQLKVHFYSSQKRQADLFGNRIKGLSEEFGKRLARLNDRLADEGKQMVDIETLINGKIKGSQEGFDEKLSETYAQMEKRISQVISHVASEKRAVEELKATFGREMREEQKALSARIIAASERSMHRVTELSGEVSAEKKALAEQRLKFSQRVESANQEIARLDGIAKALEGRLKKHEDATASRIQKSEAAIAESMKMMGAVAERLEKSGSLSKDLGSKIGKVDSQAYLERKALLEKVRNLEGSLKASSLAISGVNRQLRAAASSKAASDRRVSELESALKKLQAAGTETASKAERQKLAAEKMAKEQAKNEEFRAEIEKRLAGQQEYMKGMEGAIAKIARMIEGMSLEDKSLERRLAEHKEDIVKKFLEEQESDRKEASAIREEFESLRKELKEWQEEQARLYELLKEEE
jgi:chromosome segregation ATPase